jgi:hypothetical protein
VWHVEQVSRGRVGRVPRPTVAAWLKREREYQSERAEAGLRENLEHFIDGSLSSLAGWQAASLAARDSNANGCIFRDTCGPDKLRPLRIFHRPLSPMTTNSPPQNHLKMASSQKTFRCW